LDFDRVFNGKGSSVEFNRNISNKAPSFNSAKEMEKYMGSLIAKTIGLSRREQDSLK